MIKISVSFYNMNEFCAVIGKCHDSSTGTDNIKNIIMCKTIYPGN